MTILDPTTVVVYDTSDLIDAISNDNGYNYVYLGNNIVMTSGVRVHPAKTSLVVNGQYPAQSMVFYSLTDTGAADGQIYINASQNLSITLENLIINGRNFFGMPYVHTYTGSENVTVTYRKVTYSGPQMIYHTRGLTQFFDCDITITGSTSADVHEVGEVCKVEIGGVTVMQKTNKDNAVFWFYGSSARKSSLTILAGAQVSITTAHYFMFENNPPDWVIQPGASFTLNTNSGIGWDNSHTVNSFTVDENAMFIYTQTMNRNYATLNVDRALTVNNGAVFYMQADFANNNPLIRFTANTGGLYLNSPQRFALYNRGSASAKAFYFVAQIPFLFTGNQINRWVTPKDFPVAGTFEDVPQFKWNRPDYGIFEVRGKANNLSTVVESHNLTEDELKDLPPFTELKLEEAVVFSQGDLPLSVRPVIIGLRPITGKTCKKAWVRINRMAIGPIPDLEADNDGNFEAEITQPIMLSEMLSVTANIPFLLTTLMVVTRDAGELAIIEAPITIPFILPPLSSFSQVILRRQIANVRVVVSDIRAEKTQWVIWAKIAAPLQSEEGDALDNAVVFASEDGSLITLGTAYTAIYTDGPYPDIDDVPISWVEDRGILARITNPIRSGRRYSTRLDWVVFPAGVSPEEGG